MLATFVWMILEGDIYCTLNTIRAALLEMLLGERLLCTIVVLAAISDDNDDDDDTTSMISVRSSIGSDSGSGGWVSRLETAA